jgi:dipeptidyl aminopeptidase/acylaminoacyl peptidase
MWRRGAFCLWAALAIPVVGWSAGLTATDLVMMDRLSEPQVSPEGDEIVFVRRRTDLRADRGLTDLWLVDVMGGSPRRLTDDPAGDSNPRWAPDGKSVYFLSQSSGSSQVWRVGVEGRAPRQVTDLPLDVGNLVVSPSGRYLAFTMEVFVGCDVPACSQRRLADRAASKERGRGFDRLMVRHWDRWEDGRRSHLFVMRVGRAAVRDLTAGLHADVPSQPFGGPEEIAFTPEEDGLVFTAREGNSGEAWSTDFDLYWVPIDGKSGPRILTDANPAWDMQPVFSPDGKTLAYRAMERAGYESDRFRIVMRDWQTGAERVLTEGWDRSVDGIVFSPAGDAIYTTAQDTGEVPLFAIDVATGVVTRLVAGGHVRAPALAKGGLVFGRDTLQGPVDLFWSDTDGGGQRRLTHFNDGRLEAIAMGDVEQIEFAGWNDEPVHAWIVKPADFSSDRRYPVAFIIHGGPQGSSSNDFHYRWNPQVYAAAGYAVVEVDFHGSTGYGQAFTDSINGDWGGKPLVDLQRGLTAVLERYPWMDGSRACALGASYGGYMINWIAGNWPDGFRCLVNHDGIFDQRMMYFATEELWFPEWEMGGPYWSHAEDFERHNPVSFVDRWRTPMLVIHGASDYRVPETQSLAAFTALQRQGIPSRLLHFADENHWVLKPGNSLQWHREVLAWLDRWIGE